MDNRKLMAIVAVSVMALAGFIIAGDDSIAIPDGSEDNPYRTQYMVLKVGDPKEISYKILLNTGSFIDCEVEYEWQIQNSSSKEYENIETSNEDTPIVRIDGSGPDFYIVLSGEDVQLDFDDYYKTYYQYLRLEFTTKYGTEDVTEITQHIYYIVHAYVSTTGFGSITDADSGNYEFKALEYVEKELKFGASGTGSITNENYNWMAYDLPDGLMIDPNDATIFGIPSKADEGRAFNVTIVATNKENNSPFIGNIKITITKAEEAQTVDFKVHVNEKSPLEKPNQFYVLRGDSVKITYEGDGLDMNKGEMTILNEDGKLEMVKYDSNAGGFIVPTEHVLGAFRIVIDTNIEDVNSNKRIVTTMYVIDTIKDVLNAEIAVEPADP